MLVGIWKLNDYEFECMSFCFDMIYGLVLNDFGILVIEVDFFDVCLEDFKVDLFVVCVIFLNGCYGLVDWFGWLVCKDIIYIG